MNITTRYIKLRAIHNWAKENIDLKDSEEMILESIIRYAISKYGVLRVSAKEYADIIFYLLWNPENRPEWLNEPKWLKEDTTAIPTKDEDVFVIPKVVRSQAVERNFAIAYASSGRRQEYALYRLWRYLDVPKRIIVRNLRLNGCKEWSVDDLGTIFGDIFTEKCLKSDECVLKPFLEEAKPLPIRPTCALEGCNKLTRRRRYGEGYYTYCSSKHSHIYAIHQAHIKRRHNTYVKRISRKHFPIYLRSLQQIVDNHIEYQSDFNPYSNKNKNTAYMRKLRCKHILALLKREWIERTPITHNKHHTFKIKVTERGLQVLRNA